MYVLGHPSRNRRLRPDRLFALSILCALFTVLLAFGINRLVQAYDHSYQTPMSPIILSELQTGGCSDGEPDAACVEDTRQEFIELHNLSLQEQSLAGYKLQYVSASGATVTTLTEVTASMSSRSHLLIAHSTYPGAADIRFGADTDSGKLAKTGGSIRFIDAKGATVDSVGWGSAANMMPWQTVAAPKPGYSVSRPLPPASVIPTTEQLLFGGPVTPTTPTNSIHLPATPPSEQPAEIPPGDADPVTPSDEQAPLPPHSAPEPTALHCSSLALSELLPNPVGSDTGQEFIEVYNPTGKPVFLKECQLYTSANSKKFNLPDEQLPAGGYRAFHNTGTGLTLSNGGGTVWLASGSTEIDKTEYQKAMLDDESWALIDGSWQATFTPTPGSQNKTDEAENSEAETIPATTGLAPCKPNQERSAETNRCRNIPQPASATACKPDEARNSETNRCNKIKTTAQTTCKPNQTRNAETGRCKATAAAGAKQPCVAGQVRNPATGRCKKDSGMQNAATVKDVRSEVDQSGGSHWKLLGVALAVAVAYAAYEWRQDLRQKAGALLGRLGRNDRTTRRPGLRA